MKKKDSKELPNLPKSELEILSVVWKLQNATVREVADILSEKRKVDFWTVQTYLRRLEKKGYLQVTKSNRNNTYSPKVKKNSVVKRSLNNFLSVLFDDNAMSLFEYLVQENKFSEEELAELQKSLDKMIAEKKSDD